VSGWRVEDLPADCLVNFWSEIDRRKAKELNAMNFSGAVLAAIDQADKAETTKLEISKWLPFDLGDKSVITLSKGVTALLTKLRDNNELPPLMVRDLYRHKLISPNISHNI
jgi:hypothetical protein